MKLWLRGRLMFWEASCFICFRCLDHAVAGSRVSWAGGRFSVSLGGLCTVLWKAPAADRHCRSSLSTQRARLVHLWFQLSGSSLLLACRENSPETFPLQILQCLTVCGPISWVARGLCCDSGQRRVITQHSKEPIHPECPLSLQHRHPLTPEKGVSLFPWPQPPRCACCSTPLLFPNATFPLGPYLHSGLENINRSVFFLPICLPGDFLSLSGPGSRV